MNFFAGFLYITSALALAAAPLDDQNRAFENAVNAVPAASTAALHFDPHTHSRTPIVEDLHLMLQQHESESLIEGTIVQLMNAHPSPQVKKIGADFIRALEDQRLGRERDFVAQANAALAETKLAIPAARTPADLDAVLQNSPLSKVRRSSPARLMPRPNPLPINSTRRSNSSPNGRITWLTCPGE